MPTEILRRVEGVSAGPNGDLHPVPFQGEVRRQTKQGPIALFLCPNFENTTGLCKPQADEPPVGLCDKVTLLQITPYRRSEIDEHEQVTLTPRVQTRDGTTLEFDIDDPRVLHVNDIPIRFGRQARSYLRDLMQGNGKPVSNEQLYMNAHPNALYLPSGYEASVSTMMNSIRKKLRQVESQFIQPVYGFGYRIDTLEDNQTARPDDSEQEPTNSTLSVETVGGTTITLDKDDPQRIRLNGTSVKLTPKEFLYVQSLMEKDGKPVLPVQLYKDVNPGEEVPEGFAGHVRKYINDVRRKFEKHGFTDVIETHLDFGYRMNINEKPPQIPEGKDAELPPNLRRSETEGGTITLDTERPGKIWINDTPIKLTATEFANMRIFIERDGDPISPTDLVELRQRGEHQVFPEITSHERSVDKEMSQLRKKLREKGFRHIILNTYAQGFGIFKKVA